METTNRDNLSSQYTSLADQIKKSRSLQELAPIWLEILRFQAENQGGIDITSTEQLYFDKLRDLYADIAGVLNNCEDLYELDRIAERFIPFSDLYSLLTRMYFDFNYIESQLQTESRFVVKKLNYKKKPNLKNLFEDTDFQFTRSVGPDCEDTSYNPVTPEPRLNINPRIEDFRELKNIHVDLVETFLALLSDLFRDKFAEELRKIGISDLISLKMEQDIAEQRLLIIAPYHGIKSILAIPGFFRELHEDFETLPEDTPMNNAEAGVAFANEPQIGLLTEVGDCIMDSVTEVFAQEMASELLNDENTIAFIESEMVNPESLEFIKGFMSNKGFIDGYRILHYLFNRILEARGVKPEGLEAIDAITAMKESLIKAVNNNSELKEALGIITKRINKARKSYIANNLMKSLTSTLNGTSREFMEKFIEETSYIQESEAEPEKPDAENAQLIAAGILNKRGTKKFVPVTLQLPDISIKELRAYRSLVAGIFEKALGDSPEQ